MKSVLMVRQMERCGGGPEKPEINHVDNIIVDPIQGSCCPDVTVFMFDLFAFCLSLPLHSRPSVVPYNNQ